MYLVFTGDVIVGLFIPIPYHRLLVLIFDHAIFFLFFFLAEMKGVNSVTLQMIFDILWRNCQPSILLNCAGEFLYHNCH